MAVDEITDAPHPHDIGPCNGEDVGEFKELFLMLYAEQQQTDNCAQQDSMGGPCRPAR